MGNYKQDEWEDLGREGQINAKAETARVALILGLKKQSKATEELAVSSVGVQDWKRQVSNVLVALFTTAIGNTLILYHHSPTRFSPLKSGGHDMYRQFNIQQFSVLPTKCIYVFCVDLRTNSDYFPIQH